MRDKVTMLSGVALVLPVTVIAGCGPSATTTTTPAVTTAPSTTLPAKGSTSSASTTSTSGGDASRPTIIPADFTNVIDNRYLPYKPGTVWVYDGVTDEGKERIEITVTGETKTIMGVKCVVLTDRVMLNGALKEATFDWYAQDKLGAVWYFGEDSKEYEKGAVVSTLGSWEAGVKGALPGIVMEADPKVGDTYRQEYLAGVAEDRARVVGLDGTVSVPFGSFKGTLKTQEWTMLEPKVLEEKVYAPGVGNVLTVMVKGGKSVEKLVGMTAH